MIYYASIRDEEKAPVRARKESIHKAWRSDFTTFEAAEREAGKFILGVVKDTWVRELKREKMYYTLVTAGKMLAHLQMTCGGLHALDVLALQKEMQQYHLDFKVTP